jgi:hypothetical protein
VKSRIRTLVAKRCGEKRKISIINGVAKPAFEDVDVEKNRIRHGILKMPNYIY